MWLKRKSGRPVIGRAVVWSRSPAVRVSRCPRARYWIDVSACDCLLLLLTSRLQSLLPCENMGNHSRMSSTAVTYRCIYMCISTYRRTERPTVETVKWFFKPLLQHIYCLSGVSLITVLRHFNQRPEARGWIIAWHFKSPCMIKFCRSTPTVSVYLAKRPACDQAAANLL